MTRAQSAAAPERVKIAEAARIMGVTPRVIQLLAVKGIIPGAAKPLRCWTFDTADLLKFSRRVHKDREYAASIGLSFIHKPKVRELIYFIQSDDKIKIGISQDYKKRLRSLQTASASTLKLLAVINGTRKSEAALHEKFQHLRLMGEWFRADPELLAYVHALKHSASADHRR